MSGLGFSVGLKLKSGQAKAIGLRARSVLGPCLGVWLWSRTVLTVKG